MRNLGTTYPRSFYNIVASAAFRRGFESARRPLPLDWVFYELDSKGDQWSFERGRQLAILEPWITKIHKRPQAEVVAAYAAARRRGDIL